MADVPAPDAAAQARLLVAMGALHHSDEALIHALRNAAPSLLAELAALRAAAEAARRLLGETAPTTTGVGRVAVVSLECTVCGETWRDDVPERHAHDCEWSAARDALAALPRGGAT